MPPERLRRIADDAGAPRGGEAELCKHLANRTLVQCDVEASRDLIAQINPPPAHHPMLRRIGAGFDKRGQLSLLLRRQFRRRTRRLARAQPGQTFRIVTMHRSVPHLSAAFLRSAPSRTSASASIRRAAVLFFSLCAALRSSDAVSSSRVIATTAPIDVAPPQERLSIQKLSDLGIPNLSQSSRPLVLERSRATHRARYFPSSFDR